MTFGCLLLREIQTTEDTDLEKRSQESEARSEKKYWPSL
jgi:hypothetical protein